MGRETNPSFFPRYIQTAEGGSFEARNIQLLINKEATRDGILQEIKWVGKRAGGDDRVYVFFAGHGVINMLGEAYFMPQDSDPSDPELRGIRADEFLTQIRNWITAKDVVVFVDACHAGAATGARGSSDNLTSALKEKWGTVLTGQTQTPVASSGFSPDFVFTYCQSENSSLICRSSFIQTSGSTAPLVCVVKGVSRSFLRLCEEGMFNRAQRLFI